MVEWALVRGVLVAFFILANSFFVAAEFALVSIRETRVQQLIAAGRPGARTVLQLKQSINDFLPAVQFGVTLAALALGWLGEPAVAETLTACFAQLHVTLGPEGAFYLHGAAVAIAFACIAYFEVLLGELVPKSLALQRAERIALAVAGPMDVFIRMTRPAVQLMNGSAALVLRLFKAPLSGEGEISSPEELKLLATATRRMGLLPSFQEEMIHRAVELSHVTVREIMTPRGRIVSLPADLPLVQASARFVEEQHTRVPVYEPAEGPDHIIGIAHSKDVARLMHFRASALSFRPAGDAGPGVPAAGPTLRDIMREAIFVPETKVAVELLQEFQERRRLMAIVVDEFGSTVGLVTAEDVLEQVVGELEDEFDVRTTVTSAAGGAGMTLDGATPLRDLATTLGWKFPRRAGIETLGGFCLAELGHVPVAGESMVYGERRFTVAGMQGRRISRVQVETVAEDQGSGPASIEPRAGAEVRG